MGPVQLVTYECSPPSMCNTHFLFRRTHGDAKTRGFQVICGSLNNLVDYYWLDESQV